MNRINIKDPRFQPRPGWGGQISRWIKINSQSKILPIISITVFALGLYMLLTK